MAYGYLGQNTPNQTVNNSGVFSITDSKNLQSQGKLGGSLELIEEQTVSGVSAVDFTSIKENVYDVHLLQWSGIYLGSATANYLEIRLSNNGGTSYINSGYQYATQYVGTNGNFGEIKSTSADAIEKISFSATENELYLSLIHI